MKNWRVPSMWAGAEVWIIGGGSSLPRQFEVPSDIIEKVESGQESVRAYSDYLQPLHNKHIIGTNMAFSLGSWISVAYFCDRSFFRAHCESLRKFRNLKVSCATYPCTYNIKDIKILKRSNTRGLSTNPNEINWNNNSGAAAINFAVLAGAKKINLLGFDMKPAESGRTHWHQGYALYNNPTTKAVFGRFMTNFPSIAEDAKKLGVEIVNVNIDSALNCFPKVTLKEVLS